MTDQFSFPTDPFATAGQPEYVSATAAYNLASTLAPVGAATVHTAGEARAALSAARTRGLGVRVLTTGHAADSAAPFAEQLLVRTAMTGPVVIDPDARTADIPAGTLWQQVADAAAPYGLAALHGSSGTVGAIGYLLGGGMSFYGRQYGVAANSIISITLLLADGSTVTTDADHDPELFWALRGGGGGFGIVLSLRVALIPAHEVFTGATFFTVDALGELLHTWDGWTRTAPREIGTSFRIMNLPPLPGIPSVLTGRTVVAIDGASLPDAEGDAEAGAAALRLALQRTAKPLLDTWHSASPAEVPLTHMDPPQPAPFIADHLLIHQPDDTATASFVELASPDRSGALAFVELRQLGGAFLEGSLIGGAVDHFDAAFSLYAAGVVPVKEAVDVVTSQLTDVVATFEPWDAGLAAPTMVSNYDGPSRLFDTATARRVAEVRNRVDPTRLFEAGIARGSLLPA